MEFLSRLHPLIVHFPIVLLLSYCVMESTGVVFKKEFFHKAALIVLISGIVFALIAVLTGNQASEILKPVLKNKPAEISEAIEAHEQMATITIWYFFAVLVLRGWLLIKNKFNYKWKLICMLLAVLGCYFIIRSGLLGGKLVFEFGIGTKLF